MASVIKLSTFLGGNAHPAFLSAKSVDGKLSERHQNGVRWWKNAGGVRADGRRNGGSPGLIGRESVGRRELIAASVAAFTGVACACCAQSAEAFVRKRVKKREKRKEEKEQEKEQEKEKEKEKEEEKRDEVSSKWEYGSPCGPGRWGQVCAGGFQQSPINFEMDKVQTREDSTGDLVFDYQPVSPTFFNTGHGTMQVNFPGGVNKLRIGERVLELIQFHFHSPSEHTFNGMRYSMEAHLVHGDPVSKALAVVGIMLDAKDNVLPNRALQAALEYSPREHLKTVEGPAGAMLSPSILLPPTRQSRTYMHYPGSLTTPPCSEGVDWFVMETPVTIAESQLVEFLRFVGDFKTLALNNRPVQPLGERMVERGMATVII